MTEKRTRTQKPRALDADGKPVPFNREFKKGDKLKDLLVLACPPDPKTGAKSIPLLAKSVSVSKQALGHAMGRGRVTPGLAQKIVDVADGRVTLNDLSPFIFT